MSLKEVRRKRALLIAQMKAITVKEDALADGENLPQEDVDQFAALQTQVETLDQRISRLEALADAEADTATDVDGEDGDPDPDKGMETQDDDKDGKNDKGRVASYGAGRAGRKAQTGTRGEGTPKKGLVLGGLIKMMALSGNRHFAAIEAKKLYGDRHPVTKALEVSSGAAGGLIVPPDYVAELIELLRARAVVRDAGPRVISMPRGTMTMPRQSQAATAGYGSELALISTSQQAVDAIVATFKKLTALVPVSNDLLRYADPSIDALVRDDLVKVFALREDAAFIRSDGTQDSPRGFLSFVLPGQTIPSNPTYAFETAAQELGGAINMLEQSNVAIQNPCWFMSPRSKNYLLNVQNTIGAYIYRDEMKDGTLLGYPFKITTQIPNNLSVGSNGDCSEVYFVEMTDAMIFDSMSLELSVSREATYTDANGSNISTFQQDQTLIRAISEHDFQMRHNEAIAVITGVRWAPAIS
jgi:HK97 family phage major capsid protein